MGTGRWEEVGSPCMDGVARWSCGGASAMGQRGWTRASYRDGVHRGGGYTQDDARADGTTHVVTVTRDGNTHDGGRRRRARELGWHCCACRARRGEAEERTVERLCVCMLV